MNNVERYSDYKDSGVEWIGEIPSGWEVGRLQWMTSRRQHPNKGNAESNVLSLSYGNIVQRAQNNEGLLPESYETYNIVEDGDVVLRLTDLQNDKRSLRTGLVSQRGIITSAYITVAPLEGTEPRYLRYILHSFDTVKGLYGLAGGVRQSLTYDDVRLLKFLQPGINEQAAIADYLDEQTSEIDSLVADQEKSIELLQEYRKAVISEAVTKGLDPNVPMKDSGIDWIGKIPEGWDKSKIKYEFINRDSERVPIEASLREQSSGGIYPYYGASGVVDSIDDFIFDETLLLIGEDGANLRLRNLPLVYVASGKYWVNNHAHILQPLSRITLKYAAYQLELVDLENYLTGSTQPKLTQENLGSIPTVLPSLEEQVAIVNAIDSKANSIDSLIADKQQLIAKLKEYRKSLISEAVTGKFKVPGVEEG